MTSLSWEAIKRKVQDRANHCCEYCKTCIDNIGQTLHIEHIIPNDGNQLDNLCLACPNCNLSKGQATYAPDPKSGKSVPLFNPRLQIWNDHFEWHNNGTVIMGKTSTGRATVERLKMNREYILVARSRWVKAGFHPPR